MLNPDDFTFEAVRLEFRGGNYSGARHSEVRLGPEHQRDPRFLAFLDLFNECVQAAIVAEAQRPPTFGGIS